MAAKLNLFAKQPIALLRQHKCGLHITHPVPRLYSLSRKAYALGKHPMSFGRYRQLGLGNSEALDSI